MPTASPKLEWCIVRLGDDVNWWITEISDPVRWDVDGLGIIDPRQISHILELLEPLRDYGLQSSIVDAAFYTFVIAEDVGEGKVKLVRVSENVTETEETVFALPDTLDEEKGPYADFLNHITRLRVKMLNDLIDFSANLTIEDLEEEIREGQNQDYMEGSAVHFFTEITDILEYVPEGFELDEDEETSNDGDQDEAKNIDEDLPDFEEGEDEKIEEDETMRWDEEDEDEDEEETEIAEEDDLSGEDQGEEERGR